MLTFIQIAAVARQFAVLHNALKFEALHLLSAVFSSEYSVSFHYLTSSGKVSIVTSMIYVDLMQLNFQNFCPLKLEKLKFYFPLLGEIQLPSSS